MIGHKQIIDVRMQGLAPTDVFLHLKPHPPRRNDGFWNPEEQLINHETDYPDVYVGSDNPKRADLSWMIGLTVHLIPSATTTNEQYRDWWIACTEAKPKFLIGIDPDGELNS